MALLLIILWIALATVAPAGWVVHIDYTAVFAIETRATPTPSAATIAGKTAAAVIKVTNGALTTLATITTITAVATIKAVIHVRKRGEFTRQLVRFDTKELCSRA